MAQNTTKGNKKGLVKNADNPRPPPKDPPFDTGVVCGHLSQLRLHCVDKENECRLRPRVSGALHRHELPKCSAGAHEHIQMLVTMLKETNESPFAFSGTLRNVRKRKREVVNESEREKDTHAPVGRDEANTHADPTALNLHELAKAPVVFTLLQLPFTHEYSLYLFD